MDASRRPRSTGRGAHRVAAALVVVAALLALAVRGVGVDARLDAQLSGIQGSLALGAVYAPSGLVASSSATTVDLSWAPGANGDGYVLLGGPADETGQCADVAYSVVGTTTGTTYTDLRSAPQGRQYCYMVQTSLASWTSVLANPTAVVPLGFVVDAVTLQNGNRAGRLDTGDRIVVHFSRPVDPATGPGSSQTVCATNTGTIVLGANASSGSCEATETNRLGALSGGTHNTNVRFRATYAWSGGNQTLTVTVGSRRSGSAGTSAGGTFTFQPTKTTSAVLSATGRAHVCDTDADGACLPQATGAF